MARQEQQSTTPLLEVGQHIGPFEIIAPLRTRASGSSEQRSRSRPRTQTGSARLTRQGGQADLYLVRPIPGKADSGRWLKLQRRLFGDSPELVARYKLGVLKIAEKKYEANLVDEIDYLHRVQHARLIVPYSERFEKVIPAHQQRRPLVYKHQGVDFPYIVLVYETGGSLMDYLRRGNKGSGRQRTLRAAQAVFLVRQMADVLGALHRANIVHRDVAPANIVFHTPVGPAFAPTFEAVLIDLAAANSFPKFRLREPWGRWRYLPPESQPQQYTSDPEPEVGPQIDIYMLGLLLYELLTGRLEHQDAAHRRDRTYREKPIIERNPKARVSPELQKLVAEAINRDVVARRQALPSMEVFAQRLSALPEAGQSVGMSRALLNWIVLGLIAFSVVIALGVTFRIVQGNAVPTAVPQPTETATAFVTATPAATATATPIPTATPVTPTITRVPSRP